jgi:DNA polymerase alpha subunit A
MFAPVVDFIFLQEDDVIPEPPSSDIPRGVLPRLIATLVNRRPQVRALMKDKTVSPAKLLQVQ